MKSSRFAHDDGSPLLSVFESFLSARWIAGNREEQEMLRNFEIQKEHFEKTDGYLAARTYRADSEQKIDGNSERNFRRR